MSRAARLVPAAALVVIAASASAQPAPADRGRLSVGGGAVIASAHPGAARETGVAILVGGDLPLDRLAHAVGLPMWSAERVRVRVEAAWARQAIDVARPAGVAGNVENARASGAVRLDLLPAARRVRPYLLAGGGVARVSTRSVVHDLGATMPGGAFDETSSEVVPTSFGGVGVSTALGHRVGAFTEARLDRVSTSVAPTTGAQVLAGVSLRLTR